MAARIFVRLRPGRRQVPQFRQVGEAGRFHIAQHGTGQADIGEHRFAAQLAAGQQKMPRLEPEEAHRQRCLRRIAAHRAGAAIDTARHIDGNHTPRRTQRIGNDAIHIPCQAGAEHRIDHQLRARSLPPA